MSAEDIIVVGGAGYIGSHVCKMLAQNGFNPIVIDNFSTGHKHAVRWGPYVEADVRDRASIGDALRTHSSTRTVIHLASSIEVGFGERHPSEFYINNVQGALNLLDAMRDHEMGQLVFSSTCATYGESKVMPLTEDQQQTPFSVYGKTKLAIEHMIQSYHKAYGLKYVTLRYFNAAGADPDGEIGEEHDPETHLIPNAIAATKNPEKGMKLFGDDYDTPDGTCVRDYIHVMDIAAAHIKCLEALEGGLTNAEVNIGTGTGLTNLQILEMVEKVTGRKVPHEVAPRREGDVSQLYSDPSQARKILGFEPLHSDLENIVKTAFEFHRTRS